MFGRLPAGPYRTLHLPDGTDVPYYILPFDENGITTAPLTQQDLLDRAGNYSDIFLFSHGWNNDWTVATRRYEHFISGFMNLRHQFNLPAPAGYRPLLAGVFWPSAVLVRDEEEAPLMAGTIPDAMVDEAVGEEREILREIASRIPPGSVERFYELAQSDKHSLEEGLELARMLQPLYSTSAEDVGGGSLPTPADLLASWQAVAAAEAKPETDSDDFGVAGGAAVAPQAAGIFGTIGNLARNAIRGTTVWMMKDRAGTVGTRGLGKVLEHLLGSTTSRIHMIGHSFGGKVVLSALCSIATPARKVHSMLLLQPAVSHLCFADKVPVRNAPGGYRAALDRVERPIMTTFSSRDFPLTRTFHLAVIRPSDLGEAKIAAAGEPPNWFAALGGFGPRRAGEKLIDMQLPKKEYKLDPGVRIFGLRADATISGHGDISNESTWWALYDLIRR